MADIYGQLVAAQLEGLSADPTGIAGRVYYETDTGLFKVYNSVAGAWRTVLDTVTGLSNPMDSEGDMVYGGASGVATKLDAGSAGQLLMANGAAAPAWTNTITGSTKTFQGATDCDLIIRAGDASSYAALNLYSNNAANVVIGAAGALNDFVTGSTPGDFVIKTASEPIFFTSDGTNIQGQMSASGLWTFGTTGTTGQAITVRNGSTASDVMESRNHDTTTSSDAVRCLTLTKGSTTNTTSQVFALFRINAGGTNSGSITANGANAATFTSTSDGRLKENVTGLPGQLESIKSLKPCEFDFKDGSGHQVGFIAQEIQQVYPDVVAEGADGYLTVSGWDKTTARLVKAIQELAAEVEQLKAQLAST